MARIKKAVIPVGGLGTRFLPITKSVPKEMLPLVDIPIIYYIVKEVIDSGIEDILLISNYNKVSIENYFASNKNLEDRVKDNRELYQKMQDTLLSAHIHFIYESKALGNGNSLMKAKEFVGHDSFALLWGDDIISSNVPALAQLLDVYNKYGFNIVGVAKVQHQDVSKYGIIKFKNFDEKSIKDIVEKPTIDAAPSDYAAVGRYIVNPEIFDALNKIDQQNGEYYFTDALHLLLSYQACHACIIEGTYFDTGSKLGYMKAATSFALADSKIGKDYYEYLKEIIK